EQGLEEIAAAVDLDLAAFLCLELRNLLGDVALEQGGIVPLDLIERPRSYEFRPGVESRRNLVRRIGGLWPGACEDLIRLAAEDEGARAIGPPGHDLAKFFVERGANPPAVPEAAGPVLVGASRSLHHTVQSHEGAHHQLSHVPLPHLLARRKALWNVLEFDGHLKPQMLPALVDRDGWRRKGGVSESADRYG